MEGLYQAVCRIARPDPEHRALFIDDFNLEGIGVVGDSVVPDHAYEVAAQIIEVKLDGPFGKSPG